MLSKIVKFITSLCAAAFVLMLLGFFFLPLPGSATVLMYHFLGTEELAQQRGNFVSDKTFGEQMNFLSRMGYTVISMDDYYATLSKKRKAGFKEVVITFDDGNYTYETKAFPVLKSHDFPSTIFVVSESVKEVIKASMSRETILKLMESGLVTVGSHSKTHPLLSRLDDDKLLDEVAGSKAELEEMFSLPVNYMAYPSGDVDERVYKVTRDAGYKLAFTTSYKNLDDVSLSPWTLARTKISEDSANPFIFWIKVSGIYQQFKQFRYRIKSWF